ncbi:unnamed protein product [Effrenium voratum]|uniref:Uncharacterized protein n=1 Tax=Effrenium voratum TaxID=2562239 RepID=A0AA36IMN6_9DINO|nr:unnamed protein product [Effrenium voratum]
MNACQPHGALPLASLAANIRSLDASSAIFSANSLPARAMDWARSKLSSASSAGRRAVTAIRGTSKSPKASSGAPHPIPPGKENMPCPINGMFLNSVEADRAREAADALRDMENDPDIVEERRAKDKVPELPLRPQPGPFVPLEVVQGAHRPSAATRAMVERIGGIPRLQQFTEKFYERSFVDPHIDRFIAEHSEPHGRRFAFWIAEKLGCGTPWTEERRTRPRKYMHFGDERMQVSHDRSSAHFAAWYSPKREGHKRGLHFVPEDARVWMRLHFWAARETGLFDEHPDFMDYYMRFIGHFVSVYSSKSPPFTRESARWSADPKNIQRYLEAGNRMTDVLGKDVEEELRKLPAEERIYTGSRAAIPSWPYNQA